MLQNGKLDINTSRLRDSTNGLRLTAKQKIESDRGRVIFSSPLRRMQSKAQVFSLESNAAVRSRLTHSLEVAHVGRYIVQKLQKLAENDGDKDLFEAFVLAESIVETACLLHDIGNPPFGHLGEAAIKEWFKENSKELYSKSMASSDEFALIDTKNPQYKDFENFDGNPQGLRVVMTLQGEAGKKGMNLTYAQIASIIKYPKFSNDDDIDWKKIGAFSSESTDIKKIWSELGLGRGKRFPLVCVMEAADDIAYSLGDIEDGIEKGIKSEKLVMQELKLKFEEENIDQFDNFFDMTGQEVLKDFVSFRVRMINALVEFAAQEFYRRIQSDYFDNESIFYVPDGGGSATQHSQAIKSINSYCRKNFYNSSEAVDIEIAGYNIVHGLLDKFSILLKLERTEFQNLVVQGKGRDITRRVFSKLPSKLIDHYRYECDQVNDESEWYGRVRLIVDYISGMTDDFALKAYKLFNGIEVEIL